MGKHSGPNGDKPGAPFGKGPHPTPEESKKKADEFERLYSNNKKRGEKK